MVQFSAGTRALSFFQKAKLAMGPPKFLFDGYYRLFFLGVNYPGHEAYLSLDLLPKWKWV
jgi:hypothetical protein